MKLTRAIGAILVVVVAGCGPQASAADTTDLPDVVGLHLDKAKDTLEEAGFDAVTSRDASGMDRNQLVDGNWKVCRQDPPAGPTERGLRIVLDVVKNTETCAEPASSASVRPSPASSGPAPPETSTRQVTETVPLPFDESTVDDPTLPNGTRVVRTPGMAGEKTVTYEVTLVNGAEARGR